MQKNITTVIYAQINIHFNENGDWSVPNSMFVRFRTYDESSNKCIGRQICTISESGEVEVLDYDKFEVCFYDFNEDEGYDENNQRIYETLPQIDKDLELQIKKVYADLPLRFQELYLNLVGEGIKYFEPEEKPATVFTCASGGYTEEEGLDMFIYK